MQMFGELLDIAFGKVAGEIGAERGLADIGQMQVCKEVHIGYWVSNSPSSYHDKPANENSLWRLDECSLFAQ
ncbi:hypothetical protein TUM4442_27020 [Shewanella algae]|nr:hypothetical protein TUM4442_27020 [Shewanella algae]BCV54522.1 hypothetical protein TUM17383_27690 [Shewanella algae]